MTSMRFTVEDAFDATADEPILLDKKAIQKICKQHGTSLEDYLFETFDPMLNGYADAANVFLWLGY